MIKLFIKFYILIVFGFIGGQVALSVVVNEMVEEAVNEEALIKTQGVSYLLQETFTSIPQSEWQEKINQLQRNFGYPIALVRTSDIKLTAEQQNQLDQSGRFAISEVPVVGNIPVAVVQRLNDELYLKQQISGKVQLGSPLRILPIVVWLVSLALFIFLVTFPLYRRLDRLSNVAIQLSKGHFSVAIPSDKGKETEKLAFTLKILTERVASLLDSQRQFLRIVAHEFRTPMMRIQFMLEDVRNSMNEHQIEQIESELYELNEMVADLGKFIQLTEQEKTQLHPSSFSLYTLLTQVTDQIELADKEILKKVTGEDIVFMDRKLLTYVIRNLLANAVKFSSKQVRVAIAHKASTLVIDVEDDGPGVPDSQKELIFNAFYKDSVKGGLGLGLSIVKRIVVTLFGGSVAVTCSELGGLRLSCEIPLITSE
jgi:signal transduction histidine kinase